MVKGKNFQHMESLRKSIAFLKMASKKQIYKPGMLEKIVKEENSCVSLVQSERKLALLPSYQNDIKSGVLDLLYKSLKKFDRNLNGILMGYKNVKILLDNRNTGKITGRNGEFEVNVKLEFYIFQPKIGSYLEGVVNKKSSTHIGCLVHRYFNATILKPDHIEYEDWSCTNVDVGDKIVFKVVDLDFSGVLPFIEGFVEEDFIVTKRAEDMDVSQSMCGESINIEEVDVLDSTAEKALENNNNNSKSLEKTKNNRKRNAESICNSTQRPSIIEKELKDEDFNFLSPVVPASSSDKKKRKKRDWDKDENDDDLMITSTQKPSEATNDSMEFDCLSPIEKLDGSEKNRKKKKKKDKEKEKEKEEEEKKIVKALEFSTLEVEKNKKHKKKKKEDKKEKEREEKLRLEREREEKLRLEREKEEKLRLEREKEEKLRLEREKEERLRLEKQKEENLRLEKERKKEEKRRLKKEKEEKLKLEKEMEEKRKLEEKIRIEKETEKKLKSEKKKEEKLKLEKTERKLELERQLKEIQEKLKLEEEAEKKLKLEKEAKKKAKLEKKLEKQKRKEEEELKLAAEEAKKKKKKKKKEKELDLEKEIKNLIKQKEIENVINKKESNSKNKSTDKKNKKEKLPEKPSVSPEKKKKKEKFDPLDKFLEQEMNKYKRKNSDDSDEDIIPPSQTYPREKLIDLLGEKSQEKFKKPMKNHEKTPSKKRHASSSEPEAPPAKKPKSELVNSFKHKLELTNKKNPDRSIFSDSDSNQNKVGKKEKSRKKGKDETDDILKNILGDVKKSVLGEEKSKKDRKSLPSTKKEKKLVLNGKLDAKKELFSDEDLNSGKKKKKKSKEKLDHGERMSSIDSGFNSLTGKSATTEQPLTIEQLMSMAMHNINFKSPSKRKDKNKSI